MRQIDASQFNGSRDRNILSHENAVEQERTEKTEKEFRAETEIWYAEKYSLNGEMDLGLQNQRKALKHLCSLCFLLFPSAWLRLRVVICILLLTGVASIRAIDGPLTPEQSLAYLKT